MIWNLVKDKVWLIIFSRDLVNLVNLVNDNSSIKGNLHKNATYTDAKENQRGFWKDFQIFA